MTEAHITIDFETRSEIDIKKVGAWLYSIHPSTEVLCLAQKAGDTPVKLITPDLFYIHQRNSIVGSPLAEYFTLEAHNAGFEFVIWHNIMCKRFDWPKIPLDRWSCSAAKAASHGLPRSLDGAAKAMGLSVQKDMTGHRLMLKLSKPRSKWKKTGEGEKWFEKPGELHQLYEYCKNDVETEYALSSALRPLPSFEKKIWALDQTINRRGISCDLDLVNSAIELIALLEGDAKDEIFDLTDGEIGSLGQVAKIIKFLHNNFDYFDIENLQADTVEKLLKGPLYPKAKRILELRQIHSKASTRKYKTMLTRSDSKGVIRDILLYYGAHTGRWAGMGIQPHNYLRPNYDRWSIENIAIPAIKLGDIEELDFMFHSPMDALASSLRASLCAADGKVLIGADYSAIEARVLLWLVGDTEALQIIDHIYEDMAQRIYKVPIDKITYDQRDLGKRAILGLGYQMGAPRFKKQCYEIGKIEVSLDFSKKVVKIYRDRYSKVKDFWHEIQDLAIYATKHEIRGITSSKDIYFEYSKPFLFCHLPSGRKLAYKDPSLYVGKYDKVALRYWAVDSTTRKWTRHNTYGGKLVENIVQAVARDIMAEGMLRAEEAGYPIVLTVHDEVISEVEEGDVDEFIDLLTEVPEWAKGCPINAKGWKGKRYRK